MVEKSDILDIAKRRGFFVPTASNHGGSSGFYTLGTYGTDLYQNIVDSWRQTFVNAHGFEEIRSPTILPESVFRASGHLDSFDDMMLKCESCGSFHRADHLAEELEKVDDAEDMNPEELESLISEHSISCTDCSNPIETPRVTNFNLMFQTDIGPSNGSKGYLRPETAQGTLSEFPTLREQVRQEYPIGLAQVGKAYRNEISPRQSIIRTREFSQAELQTFVLENNPPEGNLNNIDVDFKDADGNITNSECMEYNKVSNEWIQYYIGLTEKWLESLGISDEKIRFRQHTDDELAHYAEECWDAEVKIHGEWVEVAGIAYRSSHDLEAHAEYTDVDFREFVEFNEPVEETQVNVEVDMSILGPRYGSSAQDIKNRLVELVRNEPSIADNESVLIEVSGEEFEVDTDCVTVTEESTKKHGERIYPEVVEPAFGIERILYAVLEHNYEEETVDGNVRRTLQIPAYVAPKDVLVTVSVSKKRFKQKAREIVSEFRQNGLKVEFEHTGSIGRRYRRSDEIGTPFAVTVDHDTFNDNKVTIRDRDSMEQIRVPVTQSLSLVERMTEKDDFELVNDHRV